MDKMLLLQQHAFTSQGYFVRKKVNAKGKPQMAQKTKRDVHSLHPVGPGVGTWHCEAENTPFHSAVSVRPPLGPSL